METILWIKNLPPVVNHNNILGWHFLDENNVNLPAHYYWCKDTNQLVDEISQTISHEILHHTIKNTIEDMWDDIPTKNQRQLTQEYLEEVSNPEKQELMVRSIDGIQRVNGERCI